MSRLAMLACGLLTTLLAGLSIGVAAPSSPVDHKPGPAGVKSGAPARSTALGRPRVTKPLPRRVPEVAHRQGATVNPSAAPRSAAVFPPSSPPRVERTVPAATRPSIEARLATAREVYQAGRYAEVPTALIKLLSESQLTPAQLAAVYELLASAYVALGQTELAIRCFSEVLSRRPTFVLDPVRTSPKIRAALDQAQAQAKTSGVGPPAALPTTRRPM